MAKKKSQITKKIFKIQDKLAWLNRELNIIEREKLEFVNDFKKKHELEEINICKVYRYGSQEELKKYKFFIKEEDNLLKKITKQNKKKRLLEEKYGDYSKN